MKQPRHCESRSDVAISSRQSADWKTLLRYAEPAPRAGRVLWVRNEESSELAMTDYLLNRQVFIGKQFCQFLRAASSNRSINTITC